MKEELLKGKEITDPTAVLVKYECKPIKEQGIFYKYKEYVSQGKFKEFRLQNKGGDFFKESIENIPKIVYVADRKRLLDFIYSSSINSYIFSIFLLW